MAKSDSLLSILWLLKSRGRMTALELSHELEVDVRTVYRYIDSLSVSGAPIVAESGPNGGYSLIDSFRETPLFFSRSERVALAHASLFAQQAGYPFSDALDRALHKIEQHMSPAQLDNLQTHLSGLDVIDTAGMGIYSVGEENGSPGGPKPTEEMEERLALLEEAVAASRSLVIFHRREIAGEPMERTVDPYGLIYWRENWYLVAYCHLRKDTRMFRCDKIVTVSDTGQTFVRRTDLSPRRYFIQQMLPQESLARHVTVRLEGTADAVDNLARHWYYRHFIRERSICSLGLAIEIEEAVEYLPPVLVAYGTHMTVREPQELRRAISSFARVILDAYEGEADLRGIRKPVDN